MGLVSKLQLRGIVGSRGEASSLLQSAGDAVLVQRGTPRWLLLSCPCGCKAELPINLDSRAGPAWRLYTHATQGLSIFPSVWRDTDCHSHFIIWRDMIMLFVRANEDFQSSRPVQDVTALSEVLRKEIPAVGYISYVDLADSVGAVPWDSLDACRYLVKNGVFHEGLGKRRGMFRRA